jgi:hypothetical protein
MDDPKALYRIGGGNPAQGWVDSLGAVVDLQVMEQVAMGIDDATGSIDSEALQEYGTGLQEYESHLLGASPEASDDALPMLLFILRGSQILVRHAVSERVVEEHGGPRRQIQRHAAVSRAATHVRCNAPLTQACAVCARADTPSCLRLAG